MRRIGTILTVLLSVAIAAVAVFGYFFFSGKKVNTNPVNPVTQTINREATKKAVESVIKKETGSDVTINEIKEQMTDEDGEELDNIINKYADEGIVSEALDAYRSNNGDLQSTKEELMDKVSDEDKARLHDLYEKYKDKISVE